MADRYGSALQGGLGGAGMGYMVGGPMGAAIGGGLGALTGWLSGSSSDAQREANEKAMRRLQEIQREQYRRRMEDLQRTMAFYEAPKALLATQFRTPPLLPMGAQPRLAGPPLGMRTAPTPMGPTPLDILSRGGP